MALKMTYFIKTKELISNWMYYFHWKCILIYHNFLWNLIFISIPIFLFELKENVNSFLELFLKNVKSS